MRSEIHHPLSLASSLDYSGASFVARLWHEFRRNASSAALLSAFSRGTYVCLVRTGALGLVPKQAMRMGWFAASQVAGQFF